MATFFEWIGGAGPDWSSGKTVGADIVTNWQNRSDGTTKSFPGAGDDAVFNNGGAISVGGSGNANEILIQLNTTVMVTDHFISGVVSGQEPGVFDLLVADGSTLVIESGARVQNDGSVTEVGLSPTTGTATVEVDSGAVFTADALIIGDSKDDAGLVTVNGAAEFSVSAGVSIGNGQLTVGDLSTGGLEISGTPLFVTQDGVLGLNQGATGSLSLDSSTWGGGNSTLGAAGVGHMTIGAGATVAMLLGMVVGSAQGASGDLSVVGSNSFMVDFLTIGAAGTGTATFGAGSNGTFVAVTVGDSVGAIADMTMDGATWTTSTLTIGGATGTGHATAGAGEVVTVNVIGVLGSGPDASGDLTVDDAVLNGGTLAIGQGGTGDLEIGPGSSGSVAVVVVGADAGSLGTLTIDGANWNVGSLTVGQTGTAQATVGTGATATVGNVLIGPSGNLAVTETAGSVGTVIAGHVTIDFGTLDLSAFGQVLIGAATGTNRAVAIGANSSLVGLGALKGDVVLSNGGILQATAPVPGALKIDGNITGAGTIQPLMTLEANGVVDPGVMIGFSPSIGAQVGDLVLDVAGGEQGTITGFSHGNTIDIKGSVYTDAVFTQGTSGAPGTLALSGGTSAPLSLLMVGDYAADAFTATPVTLSGGAALAGSPGSGALVANSFAAAVPTDTEITVIACFAAGTRIATARGPVAVEDLRVGDRAVTADRRIEPIVWIGKRSVNCRTHPKPESVWPVRVAAGAFGENVPVRDLYLSPGHAVFVGGVLVPVKLLINGTNIAQVERDRVTYFHLELPRHEVILAEGLSVESYLDLGDRVDFHGDGATIRLFPDFASRLARETALVWETHGAAPLVMAGEALARARSAVASQVSRQSCRSQSGIASGSHLPGDGP